MIRRVVLALLLSAAALAQAQTGRAPVNPLIDYDAFAAHVAAVQRVRESRRISEAEFMRMAREPGTVVLDARSERLYALRHVKGAVNLSFPEFTEASLAHAIPRKDTRILIYCNNNFENDAPPVVLKRIQLALNIQTFINLYGYGYKNVYELGDVVNFNDPKVRWVRGS